MDKIIIFLHLGPFDVPFSQMKYCFCSFYLLRENMDATFSLYYVRVKQWFQLEVIPNAIPVVLCTSIII